MKIGVLTGGGDRPGLHAVIRAAGRQEDACNSAVGGVAGEDPPGAASKLFERALPVFVVPKTIVNDLSGTDFTFGFDTAVSIATDAIDQNHMTPVAHNRVRVVAAMGV